MSGSAKENTRGHWRETVCGPGLGGRGMSSFSHANSKPRQAGSAPAGRGVQFRLPGVGGDGQGPVSAQRGGGLAWACML